MLNASLVYDPQSDTLLVRVPAAEGDGDVTLLAFDCKALSAQDKQRLRDVRDPARAQRPPGSAPVTR